MSIEEDIVKAKENLQKALGKQYNNYMASMKKWFSGKTTKQEFDQEAREIVTDNYVHLHNEFLLCIITKCDTFSSTVTEASTKPIYQPIPNIKTHLRPKKRFKASDSTAPNGSTKSLSYHLRFVPVDSIKHAPAIVTPSLETAHFADKDFTLEFCSRERSLPYFKMIHGRLLLGAIDYNLQHIDIKAVFLLAEATVWMLKNIITNLSARSNFKHKLRCESAYENFKSKNLSDEKILKTHIKRMKMFEKNSGDERFEIDPNLFKNKEDENESEIETDENEDMMDIDSANEREKIMNLGNHLNNPLIIPQNKLPSTLYDLKNLLQFQRKLLPSHSIYTINMEKLICNLWHEDENIET